MFYGCRFCMVSRPSHFTTSAEMRFFSLLVLTMNCSGKPFTHICEWTRCSSSSESLGSFFLNFALEIVALGSTSIIYFPFSFLLLGSDSGSEHACNSKAFNSATTNYLVQHSVMFCVALLWNSHHFHVSFLDFMMVFFSCSFDGLSWVIPP